MPVIDSATAHSTEGTRQSATIRPDELVGVSVVRGSPSSVLWSAAAVLRFAACHHCIHGHDMARQVEGMLAAASVPATVTNWCGDETVSVRQYCDYLGEVLGRKVEYADGAPHERSNPHDPKVRGQVAGSVRRSGRVCGSGRQRFSLTCDGERDWHPDRWSRRVDRCGVSRLSRLGSDLTHSSPETHGLRTPPGGTAGVSGQSRERLWRVLGRSGLLLRQMSNASAPVSTICAMDRSATIRGMVDHRSKRPAIELLRRTLG
jgi:hypothetical protein